MSGHSKWSQIKRQKGAADIKRGASFTKLSNAIIVAAKSGGDSSANFTLKMAIEKAKTANMPKDTIERAIKRGTGEISGAEIHETLYEIIGPQNIGIIVEAATDNKNRTTSEIKNMASKFGAKLASSGAVTYQFNKMGKIIIGESDKSKEELELAAIDAGAEDFTEIDEIVTLYTKPNELESTRKALEDQGLKIQEAVLSWEPQNIITISEKAVSDKIISLLENLENLDDTTTIYSNFDIKSDLV